MRVKFSIELSKCFGDCARLNGITSSLYLYWPTLMPTIRRIVIRAIGQKNSKPYGLENDTNMYLLILLEVNVLKLGPRRTQKNKEIFSCQTESAAAL